MITARWLSVFAVLALLIAFAMPAAGRPARNRLQNFQRTGQYALFVKGEEITKAKVYRARGGYLVVSEKFSYGILLLLRTRCVESVKTEELVERKDGGVDIQKDAVPCDLGRFRLQGADLVFEVTEMEIRLKPKEPLTGGHYRDAVLNHSPEYERLGRTYKPDAQAIESIKKSNKKARIQVVFGTWCTFCGSVMPSILRVEEALEDTDLSFEYYGLPRPPAAWATETAAQLGIKKLPTGVIFMDDKEVGRIIGREWLRPEVALAKLLK